MSRAGAAATNPVLFVTGCPRSGTTLLARILDAHPQVAIVMDVKGLAILERLFVRHEPNHVSPRRAGRKFIHYLANLGRPTRPEASSLRISRAVSRLADTYALERKKHFVGYRVESIGHRPASSVGHISILHRLWPRAKFLHIIRDGRDVCLSVLAWRKAGRLARRFTTWRKDPMTTAALWWEWQVRLAREAGRDLGPERYREVRFEALSAEPESEWDAICNFLGVTPDPSPLRAQSRREDPRPRHDSSDARPGTVGLRDWRREMHPDDIERFEAAAGRLLDELGYARGSGAPSQWLAEHALRLRAVFDGRPLPRGWRITAELRTPVA